MPYFHRSVRTLLWLTLFIFACSEKSTSSSSAPQETDSSLSQDSGTLSDDSDTSDTDTATQHSDSASESDPGQDTSTDSGVIPSGGTDTNTVLTDHSESELIFSHVRGLYEEPFDLIITHPSAQTVMYTLDAGNPLRSQTAISADLPLTLHIDPSDSTNRYLAPGVVVRAIAVDDFPASRKIATHTYLFPSLVVALSPDNEKPGANWPEPGNGSTATNGQWIDYGMDPDIAEDDIYRDRLAQAMYDIPSVSLVTDLDYLFDSTYGIFVNAEMRSEDEDPLGGEHWWEREGSLEILFPTGDEGIQANTGIRIRGGYSRIDTNPKHAFKCYFRDVYGVDKVHFPLFGDEGADEFDRIDFRTSNNYSWSYEGSDKNTMNRDVFSRDLQRELGRPYTRSRYYHLYLDGVYWGLFQSQERVDADFVKSYLGGNKEDIDVVKSNKVTESVVEVEASDGTLDSWQALFDLTEQGFTTDAAYYALEGKDETGARDTTQKVIVDIDNLIDYMLTIFYTGNFDAPVSKFYNNQMPNNFFAAGNRVSPEQGFIFFAHDNEHTLRVEEDWITVGITEDRVNLPTSGELEFIVTNMNRFHPQWLHYRLCDNEKYRARFAARAEALLDGGMLTASFGISLFESRAAEIDLAIIAESARWGDAQVTDNPWGGGASEPFTRDDHWVSAVRLITDEFFPARTQIVIEQLRQAGLYPN